MTARTADAGEPGTKTLEIIVSGRVQKVGFRACVRKIAANLGISGEITNLIDGRVHILATADEVVLDKFISMLYSCPRTVIRDVTFKTLEYREFWDFVVLKGQVQYRT